MNLAQLRYVKTVADTGSFTLAAEQCYVTQPTLSNGIAQLEQELEERLFTRTTRSVSLTSFGRHILPYIGKVLDAHDELLRETRNHAHPAKNVVRIGTSPLIRLSWLTPMLERFRQACPGIELILHEQNMADLYRMLDDGLLDFVFGVADAKKPAWAAAFLYREPLYFIPRGASRVEAGEPVRFDAVAGETFVMVPNVCGLARATRALFRKYRRKLHEYSGEALSYQVLEEWAGLGLGAAILPQSKLQPAEHKASVLTDTKGNPLSLDFEAVWLKAAYQTGHVRQLAEFLGDYHDTGQDTEQDKRRKKGQNRG